MYVKLWNILWQKVKHLLRAGTWCPYSAINANLSVSLFSSLQSFQNFHYDLTKFRFIIYNFVYYINFFSKLFLFFYSSFFYLLQSFVLQVKLFNSNFFEIFIIFYCYHNIYKYNTIYHSSTHRDVWEYWLPPRRFWDWRNAVYVCASDCVY